MQRTPHTHMRRTWQRANTVPMAACRPIRLRIFAFKHTTKASLRHAMHGDAPEARKEPIRLSQAWMSAYVSVYVCFLGVEAPCRPPILALGCWLPQQLPVHAAGV